LAKTGNVKRAGDTKVEAWCAQKNHTRKIVTGTGRIKGGQIVRIKMGGVQKCCSGVI